MAADVRKQADREADFMARALLMPFRSVCEFLSLWDYENASAMERVYIAERMGHQFRVPKQHAVRRINEVRSMLSEGYRA